MCSEQHNHLKADTARNYDAQLATINSQRHDATKKKGELLWRNDSQQSENKEVGKIPREKWEKQNEIYRTKEGNK